MHLSEEIKKLGTAKRVKKGTILFNAGDDANYFYYIISGEVRAYKMDVDGNELDIQTFGSGSFVGEVILFASQEYPVFSEVIVDGEVLSFAKSDILNAVESNKDVAKYFLQVLANKCLTLSSRIEMLTMRTVRQRLVQYVLSKCSGDGKCTIPLPITKTELAKHLGTISETLSRTFNKLQDDGLIKVEGKNIRVLNCVGLKQEVM